MGITGGIGSGKSYVEKEIVKIGSDVGLPITSIDMDKISRYILERSNELVHRLIRKRLRMELGDDIGLNSEMIDTSKVLKLIFDSSCSITNRKIFEGIMAEPIMHIVRRKLDQVKGLVFICSALFVELGFCDVENNNFIFINCSEEIRRKRLISRGYTEKEIDNRFGAQLTSEDKLVRIRSLIAEQSYGKVIEYTNEESNEKALHDLVFRVFAEYQEKIY
jgi:dephospho-CoA kinase